MPDTVLKDGEWHFYREEDQAYLKGLVQRLCQTMSNAEEKDMQVVQAAVQVIIATKDVPVSAVLPVIGHQTAPTLTVTAFLSAASSLMVLGVLSREEMKAVQMVADIANARISRHLPMPDGTWSQLPVAVRPSAN